MLLESAKRHFVYPFVLIEINDNKQELKESDGNPSLL